LQANERTRAYRAAPETGKENRQPPKVSFNGQDKLPGRLQRLQAADDLDAGLVNFIALFGDLV
jgi:hypothetical protein